jgi:hypothetical protein
VVLGLLLAAAGDPHAAQRNLYHEHVVVGGTMVERARVLAAHTRAMLGHSPAMDAHAGHGVPRPAGAGESAAGGHADVEAAHVVVLRAGGPAGPTVFGTGGATMLVSTGTGLSAPRFALGAVAAVDAPVPAILLTALDPPPRAC